MTRPETIENRWDILYRDYSDVYDEWARTLEKPTAIEAILEHFHLKGKTLADVGSGTGTSTFNLAEHAVNVIGVEPVKSMRDVAEKSAKEQGIQNVKFVEGTSENVPLADNSVDIVICITGAAKDFTQFARESERITRTGGLVIRVDVAPGWYGGELCPIIFDKPRNENPVEGSRDDVLANLGFEYLDFFSDQFYSSVDKAIETYGFVHGKRAIDHIRENNKTVIRWKWRIRYKKVGKRAES